MQYNVKKKVPASIATTGKPSSLTPSKMSVMASSDSMTVFWTKVASKVKFSPSGIISVQVQEV